MNHNEPLLLAMVLVVVMMVLVVVMVMMESLCTHWLCNHCLLCNDLFLELRNHRNGQTRAVATKQKIMEFVAHYDPP